MELQSNKRLLVEFFVLTQYSEETPEFYNNMRAQAAASDGGPAPKPASASASASASTSGEGTTTLVVAPATAVAGSIAAGRGGNVAGAGAAVGPAGESRAALESVSRRQASFIRVIDRAMKEFTDRLSGPFTYRYTVLYSCTKFLLSPEVFTFTVQYLYIYASEKRYRCPPIKCALPSSYARVVQH